jgi:hypothetical protein
MESVYSYMEKTYNLELFAVHKIVSEYAERIYIHREVVKRHKTVFISFNNNMNFKFFRFFLSTLYGMD